MKNLKGILIDDDDLPSCCFFALQEWIEHHDSSTDAQTNYCRHIERQMMELSKGERQRSGVLSMQINDGGNNRCDGGRETEKEIIECPVSNLFYNYEMTKQEISNTLDVSMSTVKRKLQQFRKELDDGI